MSFEASEALTEWCEEYCELVKKEMVAPRSCSLSDAEFLEFPFGECQNELGTKWRERLSNIPSMKTCVKPLKHLKEIACIPKMYDKIVDVRMIIIESVSSELFKNMHEWLFYTVADQSGASLFCINSLNIPRNIQAFLDKQSEDLKIQDLFKSGKKERSLAYDHRRLHCGGQEREVVCAARYGRVIIHKEFILEHDWERLVSVLAGFFRSCVSVLIVLYSRFTLSS